MTTRNDDPAAGGRKPDRKAERAARLEEELRSNLRRRKDQAKLRSAQGATGATTAARRGPPAPAHRTDLQED